MLCWMVSVFFLKQKTAYEMRISDWSSDVCSSDLLLRGKHVVTYGQPFYAGWGLTEDKIKTGMATGRRKRRLTLEQLVAGVLLRYPLYWDPMLKGYTSCEAILRKIVEIRSTHERAGTDRKSTRLNSSH